MLEWDVGNASTKNKPITWKTHGKGLAYIEEAPYTGMLPNGGTNRAPFSRTGFHRVGMEKGVKSRC